MTGEATLTGRVLPIGGLKEKTMAAAAAGVTTVLIPEDNMREIPDLDPEAVKKLRFVPCRTLTDALCGALAGGLPRTAAADDSEKAPLFPLPVNAPERRSDRCGL